MATTVKIRRSGTATATPSSLEHGEIAINYADGKVFWKDASNVITSFTFQSYALASHTHAASDITSGTLDSARLDATLAALAGVTTSADQVIYATGSDTFATTALSAFARTLIDDADAATARSTLSVPPAASPAFTGAATFENTGNVVPLTVTNTGTANSFVVNDASGDTTPFVIDAAGNVGVGLGGAPNARVQVNLGDVAPAASGDMNTGVVFQSNGASRAINIGTDNTAGYSWINAAFANNSGIADNLHLMTGATTRLTISSTGTATFAGQILADDIATANSVAYGFDGDTNTGVGRAGADVLTLVTGGTERVRVKATGSVRFVPLIADPASGNEAGDVYYNSSTNKLRVYNGTSWVDLH